MSYQYDQYLAKHKENVKNGFEWIRDNLPDLVEGIPNVGWHTCFAHDQSKSEPDEYAAYDAYFIEMICDWWAFSWAKGNLQEIFKWYGEHKNYMKLHPNTRKRVEGILNDIKDKLTESELSHHGVEGQKWGVRNGPPYPIKKTVENASENGKMEDIYIHRSVGAMARNYDILDPLSGERFHFLEGTRIKNPTVFAGKGGVKELNPEVAEGLSEQLGGKPENWQHCKGIGTIDFYGEDREAEVHWFQEETAGKHRFKIKEWLE